MELDTDKIDQDVLALLFLTAFREGKDQQWRTWKSHDWEVLDRLCEKGFISEPKSKARSVCLTEEGFIMAKHFFESKYVKKE